MSKYLEMPLISVRSIDIKKKNITSHCEFNLEW